MNMVKIHFLNTIWSDCIVLEANGHFALVDTGADFYYPAVKQYLDKLEIKTIDFIILTHFHSDHYGNIINLLNDYSIGCVYLKDYSALEAYTIDGSLEKYTTNELNKCADIKKMAILKSHLIMIDEAINEIDFSGLKLEICHNKDYIKMAYNDKNSYFYQRHELDENYNSIGIYFNYNNHHVFLSGDMIDRFYPEDYLAFAISKCLKSIYSKHQIDKIDIFKVPHHGVSFNNPISLYELSKPTYAIITNTDRWLDGYKTLEIIHKGSPETNILQTDYYIYVFDLTQCTIKLDKIYQESLFLTLHKD